MRERIRELRTVLGLTLEEFGARIGLTKAGLSRIEGGSNRVSPRVELLILGTDWGGGRRVSETWLRDGAGPMFVERTEAEEIAAYVGDVLADDTTAFQRRVLLEIARLPADMWPEIEEIVRRLADKKEPD